MSVGRLPTLAHRVTGDVYVVDSKHFLIKNFVYDGTAPGMYVDRAVAYKTSFFNIINDFLCFDIIKYIFNRRNNDVLISYIIKINTFNQDVLHC